MVTTRDVAVLCVVLLIAPRPFILAQPGTSASAYQNQAQKTVSPAQLESLVAPIALYPDAILSQALVASTYPLEVVEAGRWLSAHPNLKGKELADAAAKQPWDASVQALVMLPDVLKRLDQDVRWTSDLGNAFLAQQQDVMDAVQRMRKRAKDSGALQSTKEQTVTTATDNNQSYIEIQPASGQMLYVPQYNPAAVWGPAEYYPYPAIYDPPVPSTGAIFAASAVSFGLGVAVGAIWGGGWGGWGWNCGWGHRSVVINNNFIRVNHFNRVNVANGNNWIHNPAHRRAVPYNNPAVANRFQGAGGGLPSRPTVSQTQQRLNQANIGQRAPGADRVVPGNLGQRGPGRGPASNLGNRGPASADRPGKMNPSRPSGGVVPGRGGVPAQGGSNRVAPGNLGQGGANRIGNRNLGAGGFGNRTHGSRGFAGSRWRRIPRWRTPPIVVDAADK
jgi:hypothetical protein